METGEGPKAADAHDVAVDADAFLLLLEIGVAFGLGGEGVVLEEESALETRFLEIGQAAAHMTGTGDQGDMRDAEAFEDGGGKDGVCDGVFGLVFENEPFSGNSSLLEPLAHGVSFGNTAFLISAGENDWGARIEPGEFQTLREATFQLGFHGAIGFQSRSENHDGVELVPWHGPARNQVGRGLKNAIDSAKSLEVVGGAFGMDSHEGAEGGIGGVGLAERSGVGSIENGGIETVGIERVNFLIDHEGLLNLHFELRTVCLDALKHEG